MGQGSGNYCRGGGTTLIGGLQYSAPMGRFSWLFVLLLVGCQGARTGTAPDASVLGRMIDLGSAQQVAKLLEQGADPNTKDAANVPLLNRAVEKGDEAVVRTMLEHGADPNAPVSSPGTSGVGARCDNCLGSESLTQSGV